MEDLLRSEILQMREDLRGLSSQTTRLETLLTESVINEIKFIRSRQDTHSKRLDALEEARTKALTFKSALFWFISVIVSSVSIGIAILSYLK